MQNISKSKTLYPSQNKGSANGSNRPVIDGVIGANVSVNGKEMLYFAGAGYYQLQGHPKVMQAGIDAMERYGVSSATSRSVGGTTELLEELETAIADFFGSESAAYLPSGYLTNMAGLQALQNLKTFTHIFIDTNAHYCIREAAIQTQMPMYPFKHKDLVNLEILLRKVLKKGSRPLILSDGMFPVTGELAPVNEYLHLAQKYNGIVWIDDAHPVGILGATGKGTYEHFGLSSPRLFMGATLSKAFGAYGGFVTGSAGFIAEVKKSTVFAGATSPMSAAIGAALQGLKQVKENPVWRKQLWENAIYFKTRLNSLGICTEVNHIPVAAFVLKDAEYMQQLQQRMMQGGVYIQYLQYVGVGCEGTMRIVIFSTHTKKQIDHLIQVLKDEM